MNVYEKEMAHHTLPRYLPSHVIYAYSAYIWEQLIRPKRPSLTLLLTMSRFGQGKLHKAARCFLCCAPRHTPG